MRGWQHRALHLQCIDAENATYVITLVLLSASLRTALENRKGLLGHPGAICKLNI